MKKLDSIDRGDATIGSPSSADRSISHPPASSKLLTPCALCLRRPLSAYTAFDLVTEELSLGDSRARIVDNGESLKFRYYFEDFSNTLLRKLDDIHTDF